MSAPCSILVVDDCEDQADSLGCLLTLHGFAVEVATGGEAAIQAFVARPSDVILLDLRMPQPDGWEVARVIRSFCFVAQPTIVAVTGCSGESDRRRAQEVGIDRFLLKPVEPAELVQLLRDLPCRCSCTGTSCPVI